MTQRQFFALPEDLLQLFKLVEAKEPLRYTRAGLFESPELTSVLSGADLPSLYLAASSATTLCPSYLVTQAQVIPVVRTVPQKSGGTRHAVDQLLNPDSIVLAHGGSYAPDVIIAGRVGTTSTSSVSKALQSSFSTAIAKLFTRINAYYVGPVATQLFHRGCRLTQNVSSPTEYNLALRA